MKKILSRRGNAAQETIIPFESSAELPELLWQPVAEQRQDKDIILCPPHPEYVSTAPELDLTNADGSLSLFAMFSCLAVMAYPRDLHARNELLITLKTQVGAQFLETLRNSKEKLLMYALIGQWIDPHGGIAARNSAREETKVLSAMAQHWWGGSVAGDILMWITQLACRSPRDATVNKATWIAECYLRRAVDAKGRHGARSKRSIFAAWQFYKPAVHLWAAFRLWQLCYGDPTVHGPDWCNPFLREGLPGFLAYADLFRRIGISLSVIAPEEAWQLPQNVQLSNVSMRVPHLEEWQLAALNTYRAERRSF